MTKQVTIYKEKSVLGHCQSEQQPVTWLCDKNRCIYMLVYRITIRYGRRTLDSLKYTLPIYMTYLLLISSLISLNCDGPTARLSEDHLSPAMEDMSMLLIFGRTHSVSLPLLINQVRFNLQGLLLTVPRSS